MNALTLTSQSGKQVNLLSSPIGPEFIHTNGIAEPQFTVSVPQDTYVSATVSMGYTGFTCLTLAQDGGISTSIFASDAIPASSVTVTLPAPITIAGESMGLLIDLLVSKSASYGNCDLTLNNSYSITPTFLLTSVFPSAQPTDSASGKADGLDGMVTSMNANGTDFTMTVSDGPKWQVKTNGSTVYQGVSSLSQLAIGMPVNLDAVVQPDGSLLAARIAVFDMDTNELTVVIGPLLNTNLIYTGVSGRVLSAFTGETWGHMPLNWSLNYDYSNATFQTSAQLTNVQSLPFPASFSDADMVAGQRVVLTTHDSSFPKNGEISLTTVTLIPQTLNGTVNAVSHEGDFTTYTITLAPYDVFPTFAAQPNQASILTNPNTAVVYADSNTQRLNSSAVAVGSVMRFYGLVFNDNGALRMDCDQINDGVPE